MGVHVVVAEDDAKQAELLRRYLVREGHAVTAVGDGRAAIDSVRRRPTQLVILDVMMPGLDGFETCRLLREESDVLVLMVTARSTEDDLLRGLDLGADDYITKPYSPRELMARVRTLLRRPRRADAATSEPLRVGDLLVDPVAHEVHCDGELVACTPGEFVLLERLAREPGRAFTRGQLLEELHGTDRYVTARTVDVHVMNLRRKIELDRREPQRIVTVYGVGYKLAPTP